MVKNANKIDVTEISQIPELVQLTQDVRKTNQPKSLRNEGEEVGILMPPRKLRRSRRTSYLTATDSIWDIVGMSNAKEGATDVAENKHHYLAEASAPKDG